MDRSNVNAGNPGENLSSSQVPAQVINMIVKAICKPIAEYRRYESSGLFDELFGVSLDMLNVLDHRSHAAVSSETGTNFNHKFAC